MPNTLRFNAKELAHVARLQSNDFDKEGILFIKERQDGIFRKAEVYTKKLFRLRGNLLFFFKTCDKFSELSGVYVLERCMVQLDTEEQLPFGFLLAFESEEANVQLAAVSEEERGSWIERLHIASYECMKMQLQSLREQIQARTGRDPIDSPEPSTLPEYNPGSVFGTEEPFLEMCVSCDGLPVETNGKEPDTFASVHSMTPPHQQWIPHSHTEIVERCCKPYYLATIGFSNPDLIGLTTRLKVIIYDVKERMTNTMTQIAHAVFTVQDLIIAPNCRLQLPLNASNNTDCGYVSVMAWQNDTTVLRRKSMEQSNGLLSPDAASKLVCMRGGRTKRMDMMKALYENIVAKAFRFPTNIGQQLSMHEHMGESKLTFALPRKLLALWVEEEKQRIEVLQDLGKLDSETNKTRKEMIEFCIYTDSLYSQHPCYLQRFEGAPFKPSKKKGYKELEFAPTNLHLQRMWVTNDSKQETAYYDMTTVGAFTAYSQKYKQGGLRRLIRQLRDNIASSSDTEEPQQQGYVLDTINELLNNVTLLRTSVHKCCDYLCHQANQGESNDLISAAHALADKTRQLVSVCENDLIEKGCTQYAMSRLKSQFEPKKRPHSDTSHLLGASLNNNSGDKSPDKTWKWSGTDFVKSPTEEPYELTRLNTEAAVVCVVTQVEFLTDEAEKQRNAEQETENDVGPSPMAITQWLQDLSPLVIKLKKCVEVMCTRARSSLNFLILHVCGSQVSLLHSIKYRRDVVFSQTLTVAVSAFCTCLRSSITDENFLQQLVQIGVLLSFESLLSCYGDEMGMIEDMVVGVADLAHVTFKVRKAESNDDILPTIEGNSLLKEGLYADYMRPGYTLYIPVPEGMFSLLPKELQRGHSIKVCPVIFTIGINEQATLAEKFGSLSVQDEINVESFRTLNSYYEKFSEIVLPNEIERRASKNVGPGLDHLMTQLSINVSTKKNKNIDILHLSAEICRGMKGLRFISCKSGKDRTSMAVTLEQVQILQKNHDLAAHVFTHALQCTRSEGVRRENTVKNVGVRKYAFNSLQLMSFPKLYKPPPGTYGNVQN